MVGNKEGVCCVLEQITGKVMAEGFICGRRREPAAVEEEQQEQLHPTQQQQPEQESEPSLERRPLNIRLLSEAISSLVLLPVRIFLRLL